MDPQMHPRSAQEALLSCVVAKDLQLAAYACGAGGPGEHGGGRGGGVNFILTEPAMTLEKDINVIQCFICLLFG